MVYIANFSIISLLQFLTNCSDLMQVFEAKPELKAALQAEVGLPVRPEVPLLGFIGRLEEQKGSDILAEAVKDFLKDDIQLIVLVWLFSFNITVF